MTLLRRSTQQFFSPFTNRFRWAAIFGLLFTVPVLATVYNGTGFTIADNGGRVASSCGSITISDITAPNSVRSISLNNTTHTWLGDLEIRVYPPGVAPPPSTAGTTVISSPPDGRACNLLGTYRFIDTATQSLDAATVGCADATNVPAGDYRTSTYGGGVNPGPVTSLATSFANPRTAASSNGTWLVCAFDFAAPDGGSVGSTSIEFVSPSAASVTLSGRVMAADGSGIGNVAIMMTGGQGEPRTVITNPFGYYRFDSVEIGVTYLFTATSKRHTFESPTVTHHAFEDSDAINFTANP